MLKCKSNQRYRSAPGNLSPLTLPAHWALEHRLDPTSGTLYWSLSQLGHFPLPLTPTSPALPPPSGFSSATWGKLQESGLPVQTQSLQQSGPSVSAVFCTSLPLWACSEHPCTQHWSIACGEVEGLGQTCPVILRARLRTESQGCTRPCGVEYAARLWGHTLNTITVTAGSTEPPPCDHPVYPSMLPLPTLS